jgi:hypothetical protein
MRAAICKHCGPILRRFLHELLGPPAWARQAETAIAAVARRRQNFVNELESWLASAGKRRPAEAALLATKRR